MNTSQHISQIEDAIRQGQELDVTKLRHFLLNGADIPLYCVGSGGFSLPMRYCASLYSANKGMAQASTPLLMNHVSDETLKHCKVLLYSHGGSQVDTSFLCDRMIKLNPQGLGAIGAYNDNAKHPNTMIKEVRQASENWNLFNLPSHHSFVSVVSPLTMATVIYRTFTGDDEPIERLHTSEERKYFYSTKGGLKDNLPELKDIKTFICLYGGWGEPVAHTFENIMVEAGLANVQLCDVRNWCHGRFIYLSNHIENSALLLFLSPREKQYVERLLDARDYRDNEKKVFPDNILTITIDTEFDEPLATLDLAIQNIMLVNDIADSYGIDITNPKNKSGIDKRVPRPLKMIEQEQFGSVNLNAGKTGTLKGISRKKVIQYNPRWTIKKIAEVNNVSEATIRLYIKQNHIDRERDCQLLIFLKIHNIINKYPNLTVSQIAKQAKCSILTARKYANMQVFNVPVKPGHVSLVHDETL